MPLHRQPLINPRIPVFLEFSFPYLDQNLPSPRGRQPSKEAMGIYKLLNFNDIFSPRVYNGEYSNVASM